MRLARLMLAGLLAGSALLSAPALAQQAPAAQPGEGVEDARLKALFHASDEAMQIGRAHV